MADVFRPPEYESSEESNQEIHHSESEVCKERSGSESNVNHHQATENSGGALKYLRGQVAKKDQEVQRERALRRAAEKRQLDKSLEEKFVDLYAGSNPSVNEELKERLSTQARLNRLLGERKSPGKVSPPSRKKESRRQVPHLPVKNKAQRSPESSLSMDTMGDQESSKEFSKKKADPNRGHQRRRSAESYSSPPRQVAGPYGQWYEESHLYPTGSYTIHTPWLSPHRVVHFDGNGHHSLPVYSGRPPDKETPLHHPDRQSDSFNKDSPSRTSNAPLHSTPIFSSDKGRLPSVNVSSRSFGVPVGVQVNGNMPHTEQRQDLSSNSDTPNKSVNNPGDFTAGLPFLITELGTAKDLNKELSEKLSEAEKEMESLQIKQSLCEAMMEAEIAAKGAALVEEIFAAQKEHDEAILGRMRLANDERDDALNRAKIMQDKDGFDSGTDVNSNEDEDRHKDVAVRNLMKKLSNANSQSDIRKYGHAIVHHIGSSKDKRRRITSEEMRAIIEEKDAAITLSKKLEREVVQLKKNQEDAQYKRSNMESFKTELKSSKKERDAALLKAKKLQEELENLKMYYSLHKSLSQESQLRDQFNNSLVTIEGQVKSRDQILAQTQKENAHMSSQLTVITNERNSLALKVQQLEQENTYYKQENQKQERLVGVLRKKVTEGTVKTVN